MTLCRYGYVRMQRRPKKRDEGNYCVPFVLMTPRRPCTATQQDGSVPKVPACSKSQEPCGQAASGQRDIDRRLVGSNGISARLPVGEGDVENLHSTAGDT